MTYDKTASAIPLFDKSADRSRRTVKVTGPAAYPTGGDPITAATLGLSSIHVWPGAVFSNGTAAILSWWDKANSKLMFFDMAGAEIANNTDLSGYSAYVEIVGK